MSQTKFVYEVTVYFPTIGTKSSFHIAESASAAAREVELRMGYDKPNNAGDYIESVKRLGPLGFPEKASPSE